MGVMEEGRSLRGDVGAGEGGVPERKGEGERWHAANIEDREKL